MIDYTPLSYVYNDGGRSDYFTTAHVQDCACKTISIALDVDYKV